MEMEINQTEIPQVIGKSQITICPLCDVRYVNQKSGKTNCFFGCNQFHLFCLKCWEQYKIAKATPKIQIKDKNNKINIAHPCPQCREPILEIKNFRLMDILLQTQDKINKKYQKINLRLKNGISEDEAKKITDMLDELDKQLIKLQQKNSVLQKQIINVNKKYEQQKRKCQQQKEKYKQMSRSFAKEQQKNKLVNKQLEILEAQKNQLKNNSNQNKIDKITELHKIELMQQTIKVKNLEQTIKKQKISLDDIQKQNQKLVQNNLKMKKSENDKKKYQEDLKKSQSTIESLQIQIKKLNIKSQMQLQQQKCQNCNDYAKKLAVNTYQLEEKIQELKRTKKNYYEVLQKCKYYQFQQKKKSSALKNQQEKIYQKKDNHILQIKKDQKSIVEKIQDQNKLENLSVFQKMKKRISQKQDQERKSILKNRKSIHKKEKEQQENKDIQTKLNDCLIKSVFGKVLNLKKIITNNQIIDQLVRNKWPDDIIDLDLRQNELTNQTFAKIARIKISKSINLTTLKLSQNKLSSLKSLKLFKQDSIQHLYLNDNLLSLEAVDQLTQIKWSKLSSLTISFLQPHGYECCCKILQKKQSFQVLQTLQIIHSQKFIKELKKKFQEMKKELPIKKINFFANIDDKCLESVYND